MRRVVVLVVLLLGLGFAPRAQAASLGDYPIPGGHWFTEADGMGGAVDAGYAVWDANGIAMWSEFQRLGGVATLGYPVSDRFLMDGFIVQAFQKAILQWHPDTQRVTYLNVFDQLHAAGKDDWLRTAHQIPPPANTNADTGQPWDRVVAAHEALLSGNAALRAAYFADADPLSHYGLPMTGPVDMGDVVVVRCQRAALQLWKQDVPWAKAGQVTVANGGDLAKAAGILLPVAVQPRYATFQWPDTPGAPWRVDAWNAALRLSDVPSGYQYDVPLPTSTAPPNVVEPAGTGPTAVSSTRILGPFEPLMSVGLVNAAQRDIVQANNPGTATGVTLIENAILAFDSVDDARASYALFSQRIRDYGAVPESVGQIGDAAVGAFARAKRSTDGADTNAYGVVYRQGNVTGVVVVYYVGETGSFDMASQLAKTTLAHLASAAGPS